MSHRTEVEIREEKVFLLFKRQGSHAQVILMFARMTGKTIEEAEQLWVATKKELNDVLNKSGHIFG